MAITLEQAQARLDLYMAAEAAVLQGQEYQIGTRRLKRADLAEIRAGIDSWSTKVDQLTSQAAGNGTGRVRRIRAGW